MDWLEILSANKAFLIPLVVGFLLDVLLGDPRWFPHPVQLYGIAISTADKKLNSGQLKKLKGAISTIILIVLVWYMLYVFEGFFKEYYLLIILNTVLFFSAIANKSLIKESLKVEMYLSGDDKQNGRKHLRNIVGRDTSLLNVKQMRKALLETLSENLSDGVVAPLFYYLLGGIPLMLAYKMTNTLDSMIGYKSEKYREFGFFAAKIDDMANFIPARLTALFMILLTLNWRGFLFVFKYAPLHSSPNAGYPESALAGILNCRLGGAAVYNHVEEDKANLGENDRELFSFDIKKACRINTLVSVTMVLAMIIVIIYKN